MEKQVEEIRKEIDRIGQLHPDYSFTTFKLNVFTFSTGGAMIEYTATLFLKPLDSISKPLYVEALTLADLYDQFQRLIEGRNLLAA